MFHSQNCQLVTDFTVEEACLIKLKVKCFDWNIFNVQFKSVQTLMAQEEKYCHKFDFVCWSIYWFLQILIYLYFYFWNGVIKSYWSSFFCCLFDKHQISQLFLQWTMRSWMFYVFIIKHFMNFVLEFKVSSALSHRHSLHLSRTPHNSFCFLVITE